MSTPRQLGYHMPAEWEAHRATWLSWPHNRESWPHIADFSEIDRVWQRLTQTLAPGEAVEIVADGEAFDTATRLVGDMPGVRIHRIPTNDAWMRDHGPIFLTPREANVSLPRAVVNFEYNAWGGKYPPYDLDNKVARRVAEQLGIERVFSPGVVLEGGSIDVNGRGTVLVTEQCLIDAQRNPGLSRGDVEHLLAEMLGATHVIWLGEGIVGDDTDGHIDDITRFVGPRTVVTAVELDRGDANYAALADNRQRLAHAKDQDGEPLEVIELPMPRAIELDGQRLPASYANFYIGNRVVVVPVFDDPADEVALRILREVFPGREVLGLAARQLVDGLGAFHCMTQQEPFLGI